MNNISPLGIIIVLSLLSLMPLIAVISTSFLKISVVLLFLRESLALQQIPPNIVIYGMSIILSIYTMGPVCNAISNQVTDIQYYSSQQNNNTAMQAPKISDIVTKISAPLRTFLVANSTPESKMFFNRALQKMWQQPYANQIAPSDMIILIPAFMVTQLNDAFKLGFLLYLPSLIIDVFIANLLLALGMMMMSPTTISTPIKLLLFILIGGWSKVVSLLLHAFIVH